jgi:ABC-type branched-subunit amino acid transport system substrate-binding protein
VRAFRAGRLPLVQCAIILGACTRVEPGPPAASSATVRSVVQVKVAFIENLASDEAASRTASAFQGAKLAFDTAGLRGDLPVSVELVGVDTTGDAATAAAEAREVVGDPTFVGAIMAPSLTEGEQSAVGTVLDPAGVPTITLSSLGPSLSKVGWTSWRRAVADVTMEGRTIATFVDSLPRVRRGACLLGDGTPGSTALLGTVAASIDAAVVLRSHATPGEPGSRGLIRAVSRSRCGAVVWGGSATTGALVRRSVQEAAGRGTVFVGGDPMKDPTYLSVAGRAGLGSVAACPCADLSTSTSLADQSFIQAYQADFGLPPGAFAAEGWDVAGMFVRAFRTGAASRSEVRDSLWVRGRFRGLGNTYVFEPDGELTPGSARVRLFRDEGGRWIPLELREPHPAG